MRNIVQTTHKLKTNAIHLIQSQTTTFRSNLLSPNNKKSHTDKIRLQLPARSNPTHHIPTPEEFVTHEKQEYLLKQNDYSIHLVNSLKQRLDTSTLIRRMYTSRGYHTENTTLLSYDPNQVTFEASNSQTLFGTLTLAVDSNKGLLADKLYKREIDMLRAKGKKVCELSKLAINPLHSSKRLLAFLFNLAYISGRIINKATDFVIEINPRHAGYYKRILGFHQIGEKRICQRVNAPAVLLHLKLDYVEAQIACLAGSREPQQKSLYAHFLTEHEERRIANRMKSRLIEQQFYNQSQATAACN
ncbi:hypothetical protein SAMN05216419_10516 [Nitrosomonas cryotolerans]|uniref:N-acyl amino acid synthase FeeM catalytic core domain-containing protein n=1 Tax=Nitrosomonas cryotolerans ATCC 49181 TaxID=1131553 RepID=A0A1N6HQX0_9PROT|nr:hypothetical protein [Nitrosomonas cryotolerans]SFQ04931.1 hypothetical protein SAMN05216419_10516 [Nitrosomonas cryotolerans]SIO22130.1 hypothetical protein SAMN02743940_1308 [Nitrosomonas cryotolerans ATCC 49181]